MRFISNIKRHFPSNEGILKAVAVLAAFALFALNYGGWMREYRELPEVIYAESDTALSERLGSFSLDGVSVAAVSSGDETLGQGRVSCKLFNSIPIKSIPVFIGDRACLTPGGEAVGISIYTDGVLVVGVGSFADTDGKKVSPAADADIRAGDIILSINGNPIALSTQLQTELDRVGENANAKLLIERDGREKEMTVKPVRDESGKYRIGAWVRDSTIGIGTLSFYESSTGKYAALGHPVVDADTGKLLKVRNGKLVLASILGVTKGRQGVPGELHGTFGEYSTQIGNIVSNTELGICGMLNESAAMDLNGVPIWTAFPDEVHVGDATILTAASGEVAEYSCRIIKLGHQNEPVPKGIVIEITDERLISCTGGIVQGMSGSPILQDGKLVGAVTHVFVNDPLKGYGAYAYWMYNGFGG